MANLKDFGDTVSAYVADLASHPLAQAAVLLGCATCLALDVPLDLFAVLLAILTLTLAQMVLNRQKQREEVATVRDIALHAKLDELVLASKAARNEMAGIEQLELDEIEELKERAVEAQAAIAEKP
jgi:low affinity Fe/Cu permease